MTEKCFECDKDAWAVRYTQFAGNHFYCEEHAKKQDDFNEDDPSSHFWGPIEKYSKDI